MHQIKSKEANCRLAKRRVPGVNVLRCVQEVAMRIRSLRRFGLLCAALLAAAPMASAQVTLDAPALLGKPKQAPLPPPRAAPLLWPRLDPGAVLCRSEDDLGRHAANMAARVNGGDTQVADCRVIAQPVGIQIVSREGLGRTKVKLTAPGNEIGWTDVWLPEKAPPGR
ncbi:MAG: hypothetical protein ACHQIO_11385 [Nevskiales bacterium]